MKIQCDVCDKDEASVFCTADEAALCDGCDHRVHHANKLASKHQRFSLLHPSAKQFPLCDICQEKRAFVFCQQDRAILCKDCDVPIHSANEHTQKHNRYLLTGVKLSAKSSLYTTSSSSAAINGSLSNSGAHLVTDPKSQPSIKQTDKTTGFDDPVASNPASIAKKTCLGTDQIMSAKSNSIERGGGNWVINDNEGSGGSITSSISEYLIETLPGWHFEDFLDSTSPLGFCKSDDGILPYMDGDIESCSKMQSSFSSESFGLWVPQAPPSTTDHLYPLQMMSTGLKNNNSNVFIEEIAKESPNNVKFNRGSGFTDLDGFTVPQISPQPIVYSKRSRTSW